MQDDEVADLFHASCIFFVPRHELPGPYFHLSEVLLTAHLWAEEPDIPDGALGLHMCVVTKRGHHSVAFEDDAPYADLAKLARHFSLAVEDVVLQPAVPPILDMAVKGRPCAGASIVRLEADRASEGQPVLGLIDCRAMLQGWDLLTSVGGAAQYGDLHSVLSTFQPAGWQVHLERADIQHGFVLYAPGSVIFSSFVPETASLEGESVDSEPPTEDPVEEVEDSGSQPPPAPTAVLASAEPQQDSSRSRSPYRTIVVRDGPSLGSGWPSAQDTPGKTPAATPVVPMSRCR